MQRSGTAVKNGPKGPNHFVFVLFMPQDITSIFKSLKFWEKSLPDPTLNL